MHSPLWVFQMLSKLIDGVLVIEQGMSRRAFRPGFLHCILLAWTFRYFPALPAMVLTSWQKAVISAVVRNGIPEPLPSKCSSTIIGTVENPIFPSPDAHGFAPNTDWEYVS